MIKLIVIGSLSPNKEFQNKDRVLSPNGLLVSLLATHYKQPPQIIIKED